GQAVKAAKPHDLIFFVFSGRGVQTDRDRFLVTQDAEWATDPRNLHLGLPEGRTALAERMLNGPDAAAAVKAAPVRPALSVTELSRLLATSQAAVVAVFDCQFSWPEPWDVGPLN